MTVDSQLAQCRWPPLAEPYAGALRQSVALVFDTCRPAVIIACGSIIRGDPHPGSDLDIFVLHREPWRQRLQRVFAGVPCELFINPPEWIERYFAEDRLRGRPSTAHMLATGFPVFDPDGLLADLRVRAQAFLDAGPLVTPAAQDYRRYTIIDALDNARDIAEANPDMCVLLLTRAVDLALAHRFWTAGLWQPPPKQMLHAVEALDPPLGELARQFLDATTIPERLALAERIVRQSAGVGGFFEWDSEREPLEDRNDR